HLAPEPISLDDVYCDIQTIADLLDVAERGAQVVAAMRRDCTPRAASERPPSLLVQWWPKPVIAPGRDSWVNDLLDAAGAVNPIRHRPVKSTPLSDEEVREIDPDAIVISWCGVKPNKYRPDVIYRKPEWQSVKALTNHHVFCVPEGFLGRPSPRLADGARALRQVVETITAQSSRGHAA
ncbi:MAG: ABC transporter substrate-binding protein, partial [Gammaproteobacteria bacterium]|nr:ABC transporter substrate-binding protein [Gammaproteobacteria bacterium]